MYKEKDKARMKTNIIKRRSVIFALMGVFLMVSGVFVLIPTSPQVVSLNLSGQSGQGNQVSPDLSPVGETVQLHLQQLSPKQML